jgi:hypothetical protein
MTYTFQDVIVCMSSEELGDALDTMLETEERSRLIWPIIDELERRDELISL